MIFDFIDLYLNSNCNLNCKNCLGHSYLYNEDNKFIYNIDCYENDLNLLKNSNIYTKVFNFLGGEPSINPNLNLYINILEKYFPNSTLRLTTNGLNLMNLDYNIVSKFNEICISEYEIANLNYLKLFNEMHKKYPLVKFFRIKNIKKSQFLIHENIEGFRSLRSEFCKSFSFFSKNPIFLNNRLYKCQRSITMNDYIKNNLNIFKNFKIEGVFVRDINFILEDSLDINDLNDNEKLNFYINDRTPLKICQMCNYNEKLSMKHVVY